MGTGVARDVVCRWRDGHYWPCAVVCAEGQEVSPMDSDKAFRQDSGMNEEQFRQRVLASLDQIKWMIFGIVAVVGIWFHYFR